MILKHLERNLAHLPHLIAHFQSFPVSKVCSVDILDSLSLFKVSCRVLVCVMRVGIEQGDQQHIIKLAGPFSETAVSLECILLLDMFFQLSEDAESGLQSRSRRLAAWKLQIGWV